MIDWDLPIMLIAIVIASWMRDMVRLVVKLRFGKLRGMEVIWLWELMVLVSIRSVVIRFLECFVRIF
jgi:hypothetical protein